MTVPRGVRNANPGNIRHSRTLWQGEAAAQPDPDFVTFQAPEWGLRAMAKILTTYQRNGLDTVAEIIARWAPTNENDTAAYVASVAQAVGLNPDAPLDLTNPGLMASMLKAIVRHENGQQPYSDDQFAQALRLVNA
jgi:hypothetical protein